MGIKRYREAELIAFDRGAFYCGVCKCYVKDRGPMEVIQELTAYIRATVGTEEIPQFKPWPPELRGLERHREKEFVRLTREFRGLTREIRRVKQPKQPKTAKAAGD